MEKPTKKLTKKPKKKIQEVAFHQQINLDEDVPDIPKGDVIVDEEFILQKKYDYDKAEKQRQFISISTEKLLLQKQLIVKEKEFQDNFKSNQHQSKIVLKEEQKIKFQTQQVEVKKQENIPEIVKAETVSKQIQIKKISQKEMQQESDILFQDSKLQIASSTIKVKDKPKTNKLLKTSKTSKKQKTKNAISQINLECEIQQQPVIHKYQQKKVEQQIKQNLEKISENENQQSIQIKEETIPAQKVENIEDAKPKVQIIQIVPDQVQQEPLQTQKVDKIQKQEQHLASVLKEDELEEAILIQKQKKITTIKSGKKKKQSKKKNIINTNNSIGLLTIQANQIDQIEPQQKNNNNQNVLKIEENNSGPVISQATQQMNTEDRYQPFIPIQVPTTKEQANKQTAQINQKVFESQIDNKHEQFLQTQVIAPINQIETDLQNEKIDNQQILDQINLTSAKTPHVAEKLKKKGKKTHKKIQKNQDKFATIELSFDQINQREQQQQLIQTENKQNPSIAQVKIEQQQHQQTQEQSLKQEQIIKQPLKIQQQKVSTINQVVRQAQYIQTKQQEQKIPDVITPPIIQTPLHQAQETTQDFHINLSIKKQPKQQKGKSSKTKKNSKKTTKKQIKGSDIKLSSITFQESLQQQIVQKQKITQPHQNKQEKLQIQVHKLQQPSITQKDIPSIINQVPAIAEQFQKKEEQIQEKNMHEGQKQKLQTITEFKDKQKTEENIDKTECIQILQNNAILAIQVKQKKSIKKKGSKKQAKKQKSTIDQLSLLQQQLLQQNQHQNKVIKFENNDISPGKTQVLLSNQQNTLKTQSLNDSISNKIQSEGHFHQKVQQARNSPQIKVENEIPKAQENLLQKQQELQLKRQIEPQILMPENNNIENKIENHQVINDVAEQPMIQLMTQVNSSQINKSKTKKTKKNVKKGSKNNVIEPSFNFLEEIQKIDQQKQAQIQIKNIQERTKSPKQEENTINQIAPKVSNFTQEVLPDTSKRQDSKIPSTFTQKVDIDPSKQSSQANFHQQQKIELSGENSDQKQVGIVVHQEIQPKIQKEEQIKYVNNREQINQQIQVVQLGEIKKQQSLFSASKGKKKTKGMKNKPKTKQTNLNSKQDYLLEEQQSNDIIGDIKNASQSPIQKQLQQQQNNEITQIKSQPESLNTSSFIKQEESQQLIKPQEKISHKTASQNKQIQVSKKTLVSQIIGLIRFHNDEEIKIMRQRMQMLQEDIISRLTRSERIPKAKQITTDYEEIIEENIALSKELQTISQA